MSIVNYYGKLKQLWDALANYDQLPTCKCGGYTCDLGSILDKKQEEEMAHIFLMGLDDAKIWRQDRLIFSLKKH